MDASGRAPGKGQGSMANELMGVAPQNLARDAAGVSLAQPERNFLEALVALASASLASPDDPDETDAPADMPAEDPFKVVVPTDYIPKARAKKPYEKKRSPGREELIRLGRRARLNEQEVEYVRYWVVDREMFFLLHGKDREGRIVLRNPAVRRIINEAARLGYCTGTTATKEEIADFYTQRMRCEVLPDNIRQDAADKLAKLMGYNPKSEGGQGSVTVQINCVDPYALPPKAEVVDA